MSQQIGTPMDIYNYPENTFVATFIGSPPMNLKQVDVAKRKEYNSIKLM